MVAFQYLNLSVAVVLYALQWFVTIYL